MWVTFSSQLKILHLGHSHIILWCFFPFLTPPCYTLLCCSNPPFTITWLSDNPPFLNLLILASWSCDILYFFISLYQNIYYLIFTHAILQRVISKKIFPNTVVLWCSMIITLFLAELPLPHVVKCYVLADPLPPRGHNVTCEWPILYWNFDLKCWTPHTEGLHSIIIILAFDIGAFSM